MTKKTASGFVAAILLVFALSSCSVALDPGAMTDKGSTTVSLSLAPPSVSGASSSSGGRMASDGSFVYLQVGSSSVAKLYGPLSAKAEGVFSTASLPAGSYPEIFVIQASQEKPDASPIVVSEDAPTFAAALEAYAKSSWTGRYSLSFGVLRNVVVESGRSLSLVASLIPLSGEVADLAVPGVSHALPASPSAVSGRYVRLANVGSSLDSWLLISKIGCTVTNLSPGLSGNVRTLALLTARGEVVRAVHPESGSLSSGQRVALVADYPADDPGELFLYVEYQGSELVLSFDVTAIDGRSARFDYYVGDDDSSGNGASASDPASLAAAFSAIDANQLITAVRPARIILTKDISLSSSTGYAVTKAVKIVSVDGTAYSITLARGLQTAFIVVGNPAAGIRGDLTLENVRISGGGEDHPSRGPLVSVALGSFTMASGSELAENVFASGSGGAVALLGPEASMTMNAGSIHGCAAADSGAVSVGAGSMTLAGGAIYSCEALTGSGGSVSLSGGTLRMLGGSMYDCRAQGSGGAIAVSGGTLSISGGTIYGCSALSGGAVFASSSSASIVMDGTGSIGRSGNPNTASATASGGGGIAIVQGATLDLSSGTIACNEASALGGGVFVGSGSACAISGGSVSSNLAALQGGGIYAAGKLSLSSPGPASAVIGGESLSDGNRALQGGGLYVASGGSASLGPNARILRNGAGSLGGGAYVASGGAIDHTLAGKEAVAFNQAEKMAGGVFLAETAKRIGPSSRDDSIASNLTLVNGISSAVLPDLARRASVSTPASLAKALSSASEPLYVVLTASFAYPGTVRIEGEAALGTDGANTVLSSSKADSPLVAVIGGRLTLCDSLALSGGNPATVRSCPLVTVSDGALVMRDEATLIKSFNDNAASPGGALHVDGGTVTMFGGSIGGSSPATGNASLSGGGVYVLKGSFTMYGGSVSHNRVARAGGEGGAGICSKAGTLEFFGGAVSNNDAGEADSDGGGILASGGVISFPEGSTARVAENAARSGGGLCLGGDASLRIKGGFIGGTGSADANLATGNGGGIYAATELGSIVMDGGSVSCNVATGSGGGMYLAGSRQTLTLGGSAKIRENRADRSGGGLYFDRDSVTQCSVAESIEISGNHVAKDYGLSCGAGVFIDTLPAVYAEFLDAQTSLTGNTDATSLFVVNITKVP